MRKGFTLIELLVVILILGILSAIVVLSISAFQDTGNKQACNTTAKTLERLPRRAPREQQLVPEHRPVAALPKAYIKSDPRAKWAGLALDGSERQCVRMSGLSRDRRELIPADHRVTGRDRLRCYSLDAEPLLELLRVQRRAHRVFELDLSRVTRSASEVSSVCMPALPPVEIMLRN